MARDATPWGAWIAAAMSLGVSPPLFWALSLKEWRALAASQAAASLNRAGFEALAARFPDHVHGQS